MANPSVILTGASDGIGRAMALEFARKKYSLGLIARRSELLLSLKSECENLGSPQVFIIAVDVTQEEAFESALNTLDDALGGATIFIANAGVTGRSTFNANAWKEAKLTLSVNVMAAIHGLEVMKVKMLNRKSGTLCGISSIAGARGMPTAGAYSTSKAALTTHLETMRVDLKSRNISVVTIAPGFIDTAMTKKNKGYMPFLDTAERAAKVFVSGIIRQKRFVVAPLPYRFIYPVLQMLPRSVFDWLMSKAYQSIRG